MLKRNGFPVLPSEQRDGLRKGQYPTDHPVGSALGTSKAYIADLNGEKVQFNVEKVLGDGNCAFTVLGTTRRDVVEKLLRFSADAAIRERFIPEIVEALVTRQFILSDPKSKEEIDQLLLAYEKAQEQLDDSQREIVERCPELEGLNLDERIDSLSKSEEDKYRDVLVDARLSVFQAEKGIKVQCKSENVYRDYVGNGLGKDLWLGYEGILLYGQSTGISVYIWGEKNQNRLELKRSHVEERPSNTVHMLHTQGFTHFNLLSFCSVAEQLPLDITATQSETILSPKNAPSTLEDWMSKMCRKRSRIKRILLGEDVGVSDCYINLNQFNKTVRPRSTNSSIPILQQKPDFLACTQHFLFWDNLEQLNKICFDYHPSMPILSDQVHNLSDCVYCLSWYYLDQFNETSRTRFSDIQILIFQQRLDLLDRIHCPFWYDLN